MKTQTIFRLWLLVTLSFGLQFLVRPVSCQDKTLAPADFKEKRDELGFLISDGVALIGNELVGIAARRGVNEDFYYLTGVDIPGAKLILVPASIAGKTGKPEFWKTTLYLPPKSPASGISDDPRLTPGPEAEKETGIENVTSLDMFYSDVAKLANITDTVYLPYETFLGISSQTPSELPPGLQFVETIKKILPGVKVKNLSPVLDHVRSKKSAREIAVTNRACAVTGDAFSEAARFCRPGMYEYEIEAVVSYIFRKNGAQKAVFTIIGSGPNSCILHHRKNDRLMKDGDLLVIDIGTSYQYVASDLTRTIPVSGKFTPEQRKIYGIVLEAQKKAISVIRPGVTLEDVHTAAMGVIEKAGYKKYFNHSTCHPLNGGSLFNPLLFGISLSESIGSLESPVVPGSIFTVEPGIYIPEKELGIRIEDDVVVTDSGCEILTKNAPKEIDDIERLMQEKPLNVKDSGS